MISETFCKTIAGPLTVSGVGLHSGDRVEITILPSGEPGIYFDTPGGAVRAEARCVADTSRGTTLGQGEARIMTVEHLMSALWAIGIYAARIHFSGREIPVLDGSSLGYLKALEDVGTGPTDAVRRIYAPASPVMVTRGDAFVCLLPGKGFTAEYHLNYDHPMIGAQTCVFDGSYGQYRQNIADSRTFVLYEEIEHLLSGNLAKGGSLDNCLVIFRDKLSSPLRHPAEPAGHKLLDLLGDASLCGAGLEGRLIAYKSGHALNTEFALRLQEQIETETASI